MLEQEELLWGRAVKVSQQALSQRFLSFPSVLFERVFHDLLPLLQARWHTRQQRPIPVEVKWGLKHFDQIWAADGSRLEALFRKLDSLQDAPKGQLAGKICTVIDLLTRMPVQVWFHTNPKAHDTNFLDDLLNLSTAKTLLILDRGFYDFKFFRRLIAKQIGFITRIKSNAAYEVEQILSYDFSLRERLICFKTNDKEQPILHLRPLVTS